MTQPRVGRVAGSPAEGWTTYVQPSRVFGFPDYLTVRFLDAGDGRAAVAAIPRARFGHSDFGVNRARLEAWLDALSRFEA